MWVVAGRCIISTLGLRSNCKFSKVAGNKRLAWDRRPGFDSANVEITTFSEMILDEALVWGRGRGMQGWYTHTHTHTHTIHTYTHASGGTPESPLRTRRIQPVSHDTHVNMSRCLGAGKSRSLFRWRWKTRAQKLRQTSGWLWNVACSFGGMWCCYVDPCTRRRTFRWPTAGKVGIESSRGRVALLQSSFSFHFCVRSYSNAILERDYAANKQNVFCFSGLHNWKGRQNLRLLRPFYNDKQR